MKRVPLAIAHNPARARLARLAPLDAEERAALDAAARKGTVLPARREILRVGDRVQAPTILLEGWAARFSDVRDGRRAILELILPGELMGVCRRAHPRALASTLALTSITTCPAPPAAPGTALADAYDLSAAHSEASLLRQIMRLSRLNAQERMADLMLELRERLTLSGLASDDGFALPLTQETVADVLGLTSVHVNRTIKTLRDRGLLGFSAGRVQIRDANALAHVIGDRL